MANAFLGQGSNYIGFGNGASDASEVAYDNSESGVVVSNVQDALDGAFYLTKFQTITVSYFGLTFIYYRIGRIIILTFTGMTTSPIRGRSTGDLIPIPEGYRPNDAYTHDFFVGMSTDANVWESILMQLSNGNLIFRYDTIPASRYIRGTGIWVTN